MTCQEHQDHYDLYAMGLLDDEAARQDLEAHLARRCPACLQGVRQANNTFSLLAHAAPLTEPPADLRARIVAAAGGPATSGPAAAQGPNIVPFAPPAKPAKPAWHSALPWAVAASLLLGLAYYRQAEQSRATDLASARATLAQLQSARRLDLAELDRLRPIADFLRQADTRVVTFGQSAQQPPKGRVLVNPSRGVLLMASNLPALPPGRTFQMWLIPKSGTPRPAGLFQATGGNALHLQTGVVTASDATAVAVSIEPLEGSQAPTTTPIVVAPVPAL